MREQHAHGARHTIRMEGAMHRPARNLNGTGILCTKNGNNVACAARYPKRSDAVGAWGDADFRGIF